MMDPVPPFLSHLQVAGSSPLIDTSLSANNFNSTYATVSTVLLQPLYCFYFCSMHSFPVQLLLDFDISWFNAAAINNCF